MRRLNVRIKAVVKGWTAVAVAEALLRGILHRERLPMDIQNDVKCAHS
jgi:hypothetical protein